MREVKHTHTRIDRGKESSDSVQRRCLCELDSAKVWAVEDFGMQSPTVMEAGEEVLQVLEVCETVEEIKEVIVTTIGEDSITNSPPVASSGQGTKTSQVRQRRAGTKPLTWLAVCF